MDTQKVNELTEIQTVSTSDSVMLLTDEIDNVVERTTVDNLLYNSISTDDNNALKQGVDKKLYVGSAINLYDSEYNYSQGQWVLDNSKIYKSLVDDNVGNPTSDTDYWEEVQFGGGGGLEICDIGTALYVDETQGKRRYLNGTIVAINQNTQGFLNRLKEIQAVQPTYFTDEATWQAEALLNVDGCVYKFVIDEVAGTIRLPKYPEYVEINQGGTLPVVGNGMTLGLTDGADTYAPKIEHGTITFNLICATSDSYGHDLPYIGTPTYNSPAKSLGITTDSTKSGVEANLKQTKLKLRYFIQIATGSETQVNIINEIELNNPYTLFDCKYSDHELFNTSWLRSNGQWNAKAVYVKAYEALAVEYNSEVEVGETVTLPSGTQYTKQGLSVKLSTEAYTDYDFVLNTTNELFRLPVKTLTLTNTRYLIDSGEEDGIYFRVYSDGYCEQWGYLAEGSADEVPIQFLKRFKDTNYVLTTSYGKSTSTSNATYTGVKLWISKSTDGFVGNRGQTLAKDWKASGYLAEGEYTEDSILYYYIGETVQNANLIDAGRIAEQLVDKLDRTNKEEIIGWCMPDYSAGVSFADGSTFNQNGWLFVYAPDVVDGDKYVYIDGVLVYRKYDKDYLNGYHKVSDSDWIPYPKNGVITVTSTFNNLIFYPSKGAN